MKRHTRPPRLREFDYSRSRTYFVTFCVQNRQRIFINPVLATIARDELKRFRDKGWFWLYTFAIMPDHLHILIRLPDGSRTLGRIVATVKSSIQFRLRRIGVDLGWQDNFYDHVVRQNEQINEIAGYILRNPERAGLVKQGEAYPFAAMLDLYL
jgi:putative transposase